MTTYEKVVFKLLTDQRMDPTLIRQVCHDGWDGIPQDAVIQYMADGTMKKVGEDVVVFDKRGKETSRRFCATDSMKESMVVLYACTQAIEPRNQLR